MNIVRKHIVLSVTLLSVLFVNSVLYSMHKEKNKAQDTKESSKQLDAQEIRSRLYTMWGYMNPLYKAVYHVKRGDKLVEDCEYDKKFIDDIFANVPAESIMHTRMRTIDNEQECCLPVYLCWNLVSCCRKIKVARCNLLQRGFQVCLQDPKNMRMPANTKAIVKKLLGYDFDLQELFFAHVHKFSKLRISVAHAAAMLGDRELLKMILDKDKSCAHAVDSEGLTPLHRLIMANNAFIGSEYNHRGSKITDQAKYGEHISNCISIRNGYVECATLLINAGAAKDITFTVGRLCRKKNVSAKIYAANHEIQVLFTA